MGARGPGIFRSTTSQTQARNTEKIEQIGPNQVRATLVQAASGFPSGLLAEAGPNWVGHILPARDAIHDEAAEEAYDRNPIGAGPMKLVRHVQSEAWSLSALRTSMTSHPPAGRRIEE